MKEKVRNRIIGGVFVVALLIILIPIFFDTPLETDIEELETLDPPKIEIPAPTIDEPDLRPVMDVRDEVSDLIDDEGFVKPEGTRVGEPIVSDDVETVAQWAVQLGSFSTNERAERFRSQVAEDGHHVWISTAKVRDQQVYRVLVGPYIEREDANRNRDELSEAFEIEARVVGFEQ